MHHDGKCRCHDPRFKTIEARLAHVDEFFEIRNGSLERKTTAEWLQRFERADVPAFPYNTLESLLEDPHLREVGLFHHTEYAEEGTVRHIEPANTFTGGKRRAPMPAPMLGQHSAEILSDFGFTSEQITRLVDTRVIIDRTAGIRSR